METPGAPTVSVVIPAYNAGRFLAESVASVLNQTWRDLELIVVDDGSSDDTQDVLGAFHDERLRILTKENRGTVSDARNHGIDAARGTFIAFLDADDVWLPEKLAQQMPLFDDPSVVMVYCAYAITDEDLTPRTVIWTDPDTPVIERWLLLEGNGIAPSTTTVVRRSAIDAAGRYNLELSVSEDIEFADRVAALGRVAAVPACLALYRTHTRQGHRDLDRFRHDVCWILDDRYGVEGAVDRRRWARGMANLAVRLTVYELRNGKPRDAARDLALAVRLGPTRVVGLPAEAALRRLQRRLRARRAGVQARH